ncbi:MAG: electron transfer flavoprotein subunit alpha/FixB family protein [Chitinophagales bacterium]|jgi:electron transfer flavoprotein alpha subunit|nr:electron transfer flavoprotein subunit alpha/FixB family protein [Chitinophagales bacterium]
MVLVFLESSNHKIKKNSLEVITYGKKIAKANNGKLIGIHFGALDDSDSCNKYGLDKLFILNEPVFEVFDSRLYTKAIKAVYLAENCQFAFFGFNLNGKALSARLAAALDGGLVNGANSFADLNGGFKVQKTIYSGKAIATYQIVAQHKILSIASNTVSIEENPSTCEVVNFNSGIAASEVKVKKIKEEKVAGEIPLAEADLVVSGGRGLKGPENWGMIEDCAKIIGAATACSRAVADAHWRPHHEHVGQTGGAIAPNLYIAVGISGAIQHLAGVSNSKTILVVNIDPEAPFFKAADYGVVGDAFEVMPKLNEALKKAKGV